MIYGFDEQNIKTYGLGEYIYKNNEKFEKKINEKMENIIFILYQFNLNQKPEN